MIDKKSFETIRNYMAKYDKLREQVIIQSRGVLKSSKAAIYAAHRGNIKQAETLLAQASKIRAALERIIGKEKHLVNIGAYRDALEEYAEASCYIHYLKHKKIPTPKQIGVDPDVYLPALSDVVGELVRKAVNSAAKGDYKTALEIKGVAEAIYSELMLFDWRNSPDRRKFDAIKYGLEKLEDLAVKIHFKK